MELLPGEWPLHMLDVLPGPSRPLLLDGVLEKGLQGEQHAHHVLGGEHADVQHCKGTGAAITSGRDSNPLDMATAFVDCSLNCSAHCPWNLDNSNWLDGTQCDIFKNTAVTVGLYTHISVSLVSSSGHNMSEHLQYTNR